MHKQTGKRIIATQNSYNQRAFTPAPFSNKQNIIKRELGIVHKKIIQVVIHIAEQLQSRYIIYSV